MTLRRFWSVPLIGASLALAPAASRAQPADGGAAELVADTALLRVVVRALPPRSHDHLDIDPRPLRGDAWFRFPHPAGLVPVDSATLAARRAGVVTLGATPFTAFVGPRCEHGPGGLSRMVDSAAAQRVAEQPRRLCVLLSVPVVVAGHEDRADGCGSPMRARTFAYTISPAASLVYEVTTVRCRGAWTVSGVELVSEAHS